MRKSVRKRIEDELRDYHGTRHRLIDLQNGGRFDRPQAECYGRPSLPGDTTGSLAAETMSNLALLNMARWVKAMEQTLCRLDANQYKLMELRYWSKQRMLDADIQKEIGISRPTMFRWINAIIADVDRRLGESFDKL